MNVDKIIKVSREKLVQQAGSKYNPEITVIQAKIMRLSAGPSN
jgi:hypothetical protein